MKYLLLASGLLCMCIKLFGQQTKDDLKGMIDSAIQIKYTQAKAELVTQKDESSYFDNLYLLNEENRPLGCLLCESPVKFKSIEIFDKGNQRLIAKGIRAWKVVTFLNGNQFTVNILDCFIEYKNHNYNFSNGGGAKVVFEYDCLKNNWTLKSFQNKGI